MNKKKEMPEGEKVLTEILRKEIEEENATFYKELNEAIKIQNEKLRSFKIQIPPEVLKKHEHFLEGNEENGIIWFADYLSDKKWKITVIKDDKHLEDTIDAIYEPRLGVDVQDGKNIDEKLDELINKIKKLCI